MTILAIESSAKAASCAIMKDGKLFAQAQQSTGLTHSRTLLPMVEDMLKNAEMTISDMDALACSQGPGSFTGIRIGIATLKGLAWAAEKPCIGVSTLEGMAWHGVAAGGLICCVMDARRSQVYNALFEIKDGIPVRLTEDRAISLEELVSDPRMREEKPFIVGDGAAITEAFLQKEGISFRSAPQNLVFQSAYGVACAAQGKEPAHVDALLPVYLRLSQAERERQARMAAGDSH